MIQNLEDLKLFLQKDKEALGIPKELKRPPIIGFNVWKFEIALRHVEYYRNVNLGGGKKLAM